MSKYVIVRNVGKKGKGLFALRNFTAGDLIIHNDVTKIKKRYSPKEIETSGIDADHWDYIGHGKYVLDFSPESYVNHSCDPNAYSEFKILGVTDLIAIKPINKGEEITKDYSLVAVERIAGRNPDEIINCKCDSRNCRKKVTMDFFKLPPKIQKEKLPYLPTWVKRNYNNRIKKLRFL